jgi:regulator of protease activity HflC (stomatin/prohibitin superfamily)
MPQASNPAPQGADRNPAPHGADRNPAPLGVHQNHAAGAAGYTETDGPVVQSIRVAFLVLRVFTVLLALGWATGNMRQVPPGSQAVIFRFGRVVRVQPSGLVLALPRPLETVALLPSTERQLVLKIAAPSARIAGIIDDMSAAGDLPADAGLYLTGDNGLVLLDAAITWRIADAAPYTIATGTGTDHVLAALRRIFLNAAVQVTASRPLDDFLAVRPERATDPAAQEARNAVRGDLVAAMNRQLQALAAAGAGLGVEVTRADITALLPPSAKSSFDAVLDATQRAEQGLATARTEATRTRQQADRQRDTLLTTAHASAEERIAAARATTAAITALEAKMNPVTRPSLLDQLYRDRIGAILAQAGTVNTVDAKSVSRLILPGAQ